MFNLILVLVAFAVLWFVWFGTKLVFYAHWSENNPREVEKHYRAIRRGGAAARKSKSKHWFL